MNENDLVELDIENFSNLGYGIARNDGIVVFVEGACPQDKVTAKITKVNKNYANAIIKEVLFPSPNRIQPFCAMQKVCGACQMQFIDYDYQLKLKKQIVQDAINKIGGLDIEVKDVVPSPETKEYRCKIQYPISQTKVSGRILAGYYKPQTHEVVNIKHCPIQPSICDEIIEFIRNKAFDFGISGYIEKTHAGDLRHVVMRVSKSTGKVLVTLVTNSKKVFERLEDFAKCIYEEFEKVSGVCVNLNPKKTNVIFGDETVLLAGEDFVEEKLLNKTFKIGADTFFQVNPKSAENIFKYVKDYITDNFEEPVILDAYAGMATIGICVSDCAKKVVSVELNKQSCEKARQCLKTNSIENIEIHNFDTAQYLKHTKRKFDIIITDPPRKGSTKEALDEFLRLGKKELIYVSCNPATLARDLKYLCEKGCTVKSIQPFDMFPHTYHVENVAIITLPQS
ncbi:23S rRNA (uracil(1939)-C(5))-methyltransferase RlmD [bacterium]|nr:23S rRNA (uracil(1939)-C(5))-methyltransferase RlmD [bacterium]